MSETAKHNTVRVELAGHRHIPLPGEQQIARTDSEAEVQITVLLRRRSELPAQHADVGAGVPQVRKHLGLAALEEAHGATLEDLAVVERFAADHGLRVAGSSTLRRMAVLRGRSKDVERAFDVQLVEMEHARGRHRAFHGAASVPEQLHGIVRAVIGLSTRCCAQRRLPHHHDSATPYWTVHQMAEAYGFPRGRSAAGECIALIELGGGYHEEDLKQFFAEIASPMPALRSVSVNGAQNAPASAEQVRLLLDVIKGKRRREEVPPDVLAAAECTAEVTMDIELAAALAPGAEIVVYFATGDEQGIHDAVSQALSDKNKVPSAISISWGKPETHVSPAYLEAVEEVFRDAAMLGVTVCASSGDEGAMNGEETPTVNFPASSPHALSCGGSSVHNGAGDGLREAVWSCSLHGMHGATGGGVSGNFALPVWQRSHNVPASPSGNVGRGVPDVAGPADPHRGCAIVVGGERCASAGTSAVAPMWAALIAILNHKLGARCGFVTPLLYELSRSGANVMREITEGNNGYYPAGRGWNACTGLGSPQVEKLVQALCSNAGHGTDAISASVQVTSATRGNGDVNRGG